MEDETREDGLWHPKSQEDDLLKGTQRRRVMVSMHSCHFIVMLLLLLLLLLLSLLLSHFLLFFLS